MGVTIDQLLDWADSFGHACLSRPHRMPADIEKRLTRKPPVLGYDSRRNVQGIDFPFLP